MGEAGYANWRIAHEFRLNGVIYSSNPDISRQVHPPGTDIRPMPKRDEDAERERWRRWAAKERGVLEASDE
ncbi:MAG: hypothetical protein F4Y04_06675 [Chloroflexi bacterium]|nr:hypothetical protein [Chloroflexota bacterium]